MLTAESVIAKVVSFIVDKTVGKIVDLPFDKRRKACRSLTKLYYCLQALDDATDALLDALDLFKGEGDAHAVVNALNSHAHEIELATNMFIELGDELGGGLEILDPALAQCCHVLYVGKFDFLTFMSTSIHWEGSGSMLRVVIKRPLGKMEAVDMEAMYSLAKGAVEAEEKYYWPSSALDEFDSDFEDISIGFEDEEAAIQLREMIVRQNLLLKAAKEKLRSLIRDNFSIEEVLFQSDSHPYR
ncbi:MAG: hypothetical protein WA188_19230 [Terriglobales bacterium]